VLGGDEMSERDLPVVVICKPGACGLRAWGVEEAMDVFPGGGIISCPTQNCGTFALASKFVVRGLLRGT